MDKRQTVTENPNDADRGVYWWYSPTAYIVKWIIVTALIVLVFLWFTVGYWHAKRRMRKGLPLLRYHRFLVPQAQQYPQPQNNYAYYRPAYGMQNFREPPPVYNGADMPPTYQPPPGGSKVAPQQPQRPNDMAAQESGTV